jgi:hypothetical protein
MMAKCDDCQNLKKRIDGREIMCHKRGRTHQRRDTCNQYVVRKSREFDMLDWIVGV